MLDCVLRAFQNLLNGEVRQCLQPELLDLIELLGVRVGRVILIVVVQPEQGEDLVDRLRMGRPVRRRWFTLPRRCL